MSEGLEGISYRLDDIHGAIEDLDATFHWGFSQMLAGLGQLNDSLQELISIAKTPVQIWAYNQYEIARDAMRRQLYPEALESLNHAINGFGSNPGYKLEYRFHQTKGSILLGSVDNCDQRLPDLPEAEQAFLTAARYARTDYRKDAALAFLAAGWSAYCQGKMEDAAAHTQQAVALHPNLGEALFQLAKINMHLGELDIALSLLRRAIATDRNYSLKAAADGDFQGYSERLRAFLDECRSQARDAAQEAIRLTNPEIQVMKEWHADETAKAEYDEAIATFRLAQDCFAHQTFYGYLDAKRKATIAIAAAGRVTQSKKSDLEQMANKYLAKMREIRDRSRAIALEHSPSAWAEAKKEADRIECMDAPAAGYREWVDRINQTCIALNSMEKVEALARQREEACSHITAHNKNLLETAPDLAFGWAVTTFWLVGISCYSLIIISEVVNKGQMIASVLFGWIAAAVYGFGCALAVWLLAYLAIRSGAGEKLFPPKN